MTDEGAAAAPPARDSDEFAEQVNGMFDRIAGVYDLMNSAMTAGLHHRWRDRAADRAGLGPGDEALDVCCGTGDLTFTLARRVAPDGRVVGCDFSAPRLDLARAGAATGRPTRDSGDHPPNSAAFVHFLLGLV